MRGLLRLAPERSGASNIRWIVSISAFTVVTPRKPSRTNGSERAMSRWVMGLGVFVRLTAFRTARECRDENVLEPPANPSFGLRRDSARRMRRHHPGRQGLTARDLDSSACPAGRRQRANGSGTDSAAQRAGLSGRDA